MSAGLVGLLVAQARIEELCRTADAHRLRRKASSTARAHQSWISGCRRVAVHREARRPHAKWVGGHRVHGRLAVTTRPSPRTREGTSR